MENQKDPPPLNQVIRVDINPLRCKDIIRPGYDAQSKLLRGSEGFSPEMHHLHLMTEKAHTPSEGIVT